MQSKIRFLLSGPGLIGKQHADRIAAREDCELAAVVAPDTSTNKDFADRYAALFLQDVATALKAGGVDAAIISSPNEYHAEQASSCIDHRIPVLIEKPVTDKLADAEALASRARDTGTPVLVGHHRTHSSLLPIARDFLSSERFGRLVAVQGAALFLKPESYFRAGPWRTRIGGGPILINLIHEVGLLRHFCGEIETVSAIASHAIRGYEVEDSVSISLKFENGALGTFLLSDTAASNKSWEMTSGENPAYPFHDNQSCYHFAGTAGSLDFPTMVAQHYSGPEEKSWWRPFDHEQLDVSRSDPLTSQIDHFVEVVRGTAEPLVTAHDGYRNMLVVEAILTSIESGSVVAVNAHQG